MAALAGSVLVLLLLAVPALRLTLARPDNGYAAAGTSQRTAFDTVSADFGPGFNGPLTILAENVTNPAEAGCRGGFREGHAGRAPRLRRHRGDHEPGPAAALSLGRSV